MKILFILSIFILLYAGFVSDELIKAVEQKYGLFAKNRLKSLERLIIELKSSSEISKLEEVNDFFNNISYSTDQNVYNLTDYWATPFEFLARGEGDCEDYVIAKYLVLAQLGISSNKMYITYTRVAGYNEAHMILAYFETPAAEPLILDNLKSKLLPASQRADLKPIYYFNPEILKDGKKTSAHRMWDHLIKNLKENKI